MRTSPLWANRELAMVRGTLCDVRVFLRQLLSFGVATSRDLFYNL